MLRVSRHRQRISQTEELEWGTPAEGKFKEEEEERGPRLAPTLPVGDSAFRAGDDASTGGIAFRCIAF